MGRKSQSITLFLLAGCIFSFSSLFGADECTHWMEAGKAWAGPCCEGTTLTIPVTLHNCEPAEAFQASVQFDNTVVSLPGPASPRGLRPAACVG